jgi:hypothetical protein
MVKVSRRELAAAKARTQLLSVVDAEHRARADYEMLARQVSRTRTEVSRVETQPVPPLEKPGAQYPPGTTRRKKKRGGN